MSTSSNDKIGLFIRKGLLSAYFVPDVVLGARDVINSNTKPTTTFTELSLKVNEVNDK